MSLALVLLGTSASRPTVERNVSSIAVVREGETMLFDCGEGTQRQMMRYGVSFALCDIFFTHFHADHVIGVIGLMRTMALQGRTDALRLWGPKGAARHLKRAEQFGVDRLTFAVEIRELDPGERLERKDYAIVRYNASYAVDTTGRAGNVDITSSGNAFVGENVTRAQGLRDRSLRRGARARSRDGVRVGGGGPQRALRSGARS